MKPTFFEAAESNFSLLLWDISMQYLNIFQLF
jgi:hypothetical protein